MINPLPFKKETKNKLLPSKKRKKKLKRSLRSKENIWPQTLNRKKRGLNKKKKRSSEPRISKSMTSRRNLIKFLPTINPRLMIINNSTRILMLLRLNLKYLFVNQRQQNSKNLCIHYPTLNLQ